MASQQIQVSGRVEGTSAAILVPHLAAAATGKGLKVAAPVPGSLMLSRTSRPLWTVAVGIGLIVFAIVAGSFGDAGPIVWLFIVIGVLLIAFVKQTETVSLVLTDAAGGVDVTASGAAGDDLRGFVAGLLPDVAIPAEVTTAAASGPTFPRWGLAALVAAAAVAVGGVVVWQGQEEDAPAYSSEANSISRSVSSKVGTEVACERVGFGTGGATYRCRGGSVDECWVLVDNQNISGSGVRLGREPELATFGKQCTGG